jgi:AcrR family transcriptional regulator
MGQSLTDARVIRTRRALRDAFASLVQSNRYENLEVAEIATRAGVSRSTFYAHYSSIDALLAESIAGPFAVLADTIERDFAEPKLVVDRLRSSGLHRRGALILPPRLAAVQLAEILLAPVTAWLLGESRCSPDALAAAIRRVSIAAVTSMAT